MGLAAKTYVTPRQQQLASARALNLCAAITRFREDRAFPVPQSDPLAALRSEWKIWKAACRSTSVWP
jgi:hypothetical protein